MKPITIQPTTEQERGLQFALDLYNRQAKEAGNPDADLNEFTADRIDEFLNGFIEQRRRAFADSAEISELCEKLSHLDPAKIAGVRAAIDSAQKSVAGG